MQKYYKKYAAVFLLPLLICFTIAFLIPFFMGIFFSFTKYKAVNNWSWTGIQNYQRAFSTEYGTPSFWIALGRTTLFAAICIITINFNAFRLALLLTKGLKGSNVYRSIFFRPNLIGGIILGYIWRVLLNGILLQFNQNLSSNPWYGFFGLVILMNWQQVGYRMIIYIAALRNVPTDLNESASIDGASKFQTTRHVTIPMVIPSFTICSFLTLSNSYKLYDQNLALSGLSPQTNLLAADIVSTTISNGNLGPQQAKSVVFFLIVAAISGIQVRATRKKEVEA
ncbi:MAG: sugar ABC transporter permease [Mollicutes bacterium]|nr:sugar ABC transporter permease [Mollicutes bacterium]MDD7613304.1 sugar ABC transporter permease [Mollicutes bacterium]MDY5851601.1 sugar ABC transporter permease [Candidatus Enterosoma sp.]